MERLYFRDPDSRAWVNWSHYLPARHRPDLTESLYYTAVADLACEVPGLDAFLAANPAARRASPYRAVQIQLTTIPRALCLYAELSLDLPSGPLIGFVIYMQAGAFMYPEIRVMDGAAHLMRASIAYMAQAR